MSLLALLTLSLATPSFSLALPPSVPIIPLNNNSIPTNGTTFDNGTTLYSDGSFSGVSSLLGASFFCYQKRFLQGIKVKNCITASVELYPGPEDGSFHIGEPRNAFSLPQGKTVKDCIIDISLNGEEREISSWPSIKIAIHELVDSCRDWSSMAPGWITTGQHSRVRVEIRRDTSVGAVGSNVDEYGSGGGEGEGGGGGNVVQGAITPVGGYPLRPSLVAVS